MFGKVFSVFQENPEIALFLSLAVGYFVGKIKIRGFGLGPCVGVLLVSLIFGQINLEVSPIIQTFSFVLLMFCMGYQIGPQFFEVLKKEGGRYILLTFVVAITGLITAVFLAKLFGLDPGSAAGLFGGSMTQAPAVGTAGEALRQLSLSNDIETSVLENNIIVAYTVTSMFGTIGLILFFKFLIRFMKVDLKEEAYKLNKEMMIDPASEDKHLELFSWYKRLSLRAYRVENANVIGKTVKELESMFSSKVAMVRIKRNNELIKFKPETVIATSDIVSLIGNRKDFIHAEDFIGSEVCDQRAMDITGEVLDVCVLNPKVVGKTLGEISAEHGHGCFLRKISRHGHELPLSSKIVVKKCDVLKIAGSEHDVESFVKYLGYAERLTEATDFITLGLGCALGILLGLVDIPVFGIPITVGVGGGALISGLVFGWLRAIHPTFGRIPSSAQWFFTDFCLNVFVACIGLSVGSSIFYDLGNIGISVFFAGIALTLLPMIVGLFFGKFVLKLNPLLLLGALSGAETMTPALNILKEESKSSVPTFGYIVPYAFANIFLTVGGAIVVCIMHHWV